MQVTSQNYIQEALKTERQFDPKGLFIPMTEGTFLLDLMDEMMRQGDNLSLLKKAICYSKGLTNQDILRLEHDITYSGKDFTGSVISQEQARLLHGAIGMVTEALELYSTIHKHVFEGQPLDQTNVREELGDSAWFDAVISDTIGYSIEEKYSDNIRKLQEVRYKNKKWTQKDATNRDTQAERRAISPLSE